MYSSPSSTLRNIWFDFSSTYRVLVISSSGTYFDILAPGNKAKTLAAVLPAIPGLLTEYNVFNTGTGASGDNRLASQ